MTLRVPLGIALAIVVVLVAHESRAQCPFPHPAKAAKFRAELVQAYVPCLPYQDSCCLEANDTTESNVPSCNPARTYADLGGSQSDSWVWGPKSHGSIALSVKGSDVQVSAQLSDVRDASGFVTANGSLGFLVRATIYDPMVGEMTVIDLPFALPFPVVGGKGKVKTSFGALAFPFPGILTGSCTSLELIVPAMVRDPNANIFATAGFYLP